VAGVPVHVDAVREQRGAPLPSCWRPRLPRSYRGHTKLRTRTDVGSYSRVRPRSIGPP